jgi:predicted RNA-binding protein YlqC (UPF0109 family)
MCKNFGVPNLDEVQSLLLAVARQLVDRPDAVTIESIGDDKSTVLRLKVSDGEAGKIIGKQGRMARSIRIILSGISVKIKHRIALDIVEG